MHYFKILLITLFVTGCSSSHVGMIAGGSVGAVSCVKYLQTNAYLTAACAVGGSWLGAKSFYNSDYATHSAHFVDALNGAPNGRSYLNWHNTKTGNHGGITVTRSYIHNNFKCSDYISTVSIQDPWPMNNLNRSEERGTACQLPDGRWKIIESI
jgi:surface antigen